MSHHTSIDDSSIGGRILRPRELSRHIGLSLATLWRLRRRGELPEPIRLSPGCVGWRASEVETWLQARAHAHRPGASR